ncbi:hypothetical protein R3W88_002238 [Solanum pinnatisectum]|uniref:Uncharacterized protein n=1 Tax=Solanum pinnatisectum TaxID=50273 RepID=A0AAV9ML79_9SOLN|nr:hypothetical protein R3W88_002238 [Solanum pinnatisectum]
MPKPARLTVRHRTRSPEPLAFSSTSSENGTRKRKIDLINSIAKAKVKSKANLFCHSYLKEREFSVQTLEKYLPQ